MRAAALVLLLASPAAAEVRYASFASPSLGREVRYALDLPTSYHSGGQRYPVVYVLHGLFEGAGFWEGRGLSTILENLRQSGEVPELLVVAVDGGNSFFANSSLGRYEDLVVRDLVAHVESAYRVQGAREGRALLGVSMGGYAALRIAFAHPGVFGAVAAHSAMLLERPPTREAGAGRWQMTAFHQAFGDPIDPQRWAAADPLVWAARADPETAPALYFDCGSDDRYGLGAGNEELHRRLTARGVKHDFALLPGDHGYDYVRSVLPRSLRFLARAMRGSAVKPRAGRTRSGAAPPARPGAARPPVP